MYSFHILLLALLVALGVSGHPPTRQINRQVLRTRQSPGQDETRTKGNCRQMSNKCNLPDRDAQVCPADYNRCPYDDAPCVLIEPKADSGRKPEVRCGYLGST